MDSELFLYIDAGEKGKISFSPKWGFYSLKNVANAE